MGTQSEIFARYRSLFDSSSVRPTESETSKKLNNMSFVDFLFQIVKATKGQNEFKNVVLKGCLSEAKKANEINNVIKNAIFEAFGCDSNLIIPGKYTTESISGIEISKTEIDFYGLFKHNPGDYPGKYIYEGNDISKHINYFLYKSQSVTQASPIVFRYNGIDLFNMYAKDSATLIFRFGLSYKNKTYSEWLKDYLEAASPMYNFVNFVTILTDLITGSVSLSGGKGQSEMAQQSGLIKALQKIFGFCNENDGDDTPNGSVNGFLNNQNNSISVNQNNNGGLNTGFGGTQTNGLDNSETIDPSDLFDFDSLLLDEINTTAQLKANGFIRFATCDNLDIPVNPNDIMNGLNELFNNADSNLIIDYGNEGNSILIPPTDVSTGFDNSKIDPNLDKTTDFLANTPLNNGLNDLLNSGEDSVATNLANINSEHQLNILKAIPYAMMEMIISPKLLMVPKLHAVLSGDTSTKSRSQMMELLLAIISKIGDHITKKLLQNIFDSIKSDLIKLAKTLAVNFLKQRGLDYLACLSSLLSLVNLLSSLTNDGGCTSILGKLLKLLKLGNFGPMPPIPPPLVLVGGALKPGLNQVSIINDVKSSLEEKGIVTSPTMPDGTPNNMMIAIEETIKTIIQHIKTNASISVTTTGMGLSMGYGQIQ